MTMADRVLITSASGFVASAVARVTINEGTKFALSCAPRASNQKKGRLAALARTYCFSGSGMVCWIEA